MGHVPASVVSPTLLGAAALTSLLAIPILGEPLKPVQRVGGLVILSGIYLVNRYREDALHVLGKLAGKQTIGVVMNLRWRCELKFFFIGITHVLDDWEIMPK